MNEQWRPVIGYDGIYEVSDQGRIRSLPRTVTRNDPRNGLVPQTFPGKILVGTKHPRTGHLHVSLCADGRRKLAKIHRLVLEAFIGPCPPAMESCHSNDIPDDNRLSNLRWDTASANRFDSVRNHRHANARKTHCDHGHPFDVTNTRINKNGFRTCRTCQQEVEKRRPPRRHAKTDTVVIPQITDVS